MANLQSITVILSSLMSSNNQERRKAEVQFESLFEPSSPELVYNSINLLLQVLGSSYSDVYRSFAGVLLRRTIEKYINFLTQDSIVNCRMETLAIWKNECSSASTILQRRMSHLLAQFAAKSSWSELIVEVVKFAQTSNTLSAHLAGLRLIEILSDYCADDVASHADLLRNYFSHCFSFAENIPDYQQSAIFRVAAAKSTAACIVSFDNDSIRDSFKPALPPIVSVLRFILSSGLETHESDSAIIIEYLCTIAQEQPVFFKTSMDEVVQVMLTIAESDKLEFSTRSLALEVLVTLAETAPALARRCEGFLTGLIPAVMTMMTLIEEEDSDWARGRYSEEALGDEPFCAGDEAIERIAAGLGGKAISQMVLQLVQNYSSDLQHWPRRRAAVAAVCRLAEGSTKHFKQYFSQALAFLLAAAQDRSPRVQYEAIQSVGRFAALFPESLETLVNSFLPPLTMILQSSTSCDKVRGHAASALINLLDPEACEPSILLPFLDPLLTAMVQTFQTSSPEVQSPCLNLLGCIAKVSSEAFCGYYQVFMPGVKAILSSTSASSGGPELALLRGKAIECAGIIGESVGKTLFASDALEIMNSLLNEMNSSEADMDITFDYILPACARISSVLGSGFSPFLPFVMEPLLKGAMQEIQFSMVDADEDDVEGEVIQDEDTGLESAVVSLGAGVKKRVTLNTNAIQQKNQAARILFELCSHLKSHLGPFLLPALQALTSLVGEKHSADVRASAALALAKALEAYLEGIKLGTSHPSADPKAVIQECFLHLLQCLKAEVNGTTRSCVAESLRDSIAACFEASSESADGKRFGFLVLPDLSVSEKFAKELLQLCGESISRRTALVGRQGEGSLASSRERFEKEDLDRSKGSQKASVREEEEVLACLSDAIGCLLKVHGEALMPLFDSTVAPAFAPYLAARQPEALQAIAVCLLDDAIEFGGEAGQRYIPSLLPTLMANTASNHLILRQSSSYGIAKAIEVAPQLVSKQLPAVLACLHSILQSSTAAKDQGKDGKGKVGKEEEDEETDDEGEGDEDNVGTVENAVYAVGVLCTDPRYREGLEACRGLGVDRAQLATLWLKRMPLREDEHEAKAACKQLCDGIEISDEAICGREFSNFSEILRIFAEVFQFCSSTSAPASSSVLTDGCALAHPETLGRMTGILRQMLTGSSAAQAMAAQAFQSLGPQLQAALQQAMVA